MRVLKDSLKRSLSFLLIFMMIISLIDINSVVYASSKERPKITNDLCLATMYYDLSTVDSTFYKPESMIFGKHYGVECIDDITIPIDFSECESLSDYTPDNIESVNLSLGHLSVDCSKAYYTDKDWYSNINSYITLGYYTLSGMNRSFNELFDKYLDNKISFSDYDLNNLSNDESTKLYNAINSVKDDFLSEDNEFKVTINYKNLTSISTTLYLINYNYYQIGGNGVTFIEDVIDYYQDAKSGSPSDTFRHSLAISTGSTGACTEYVISLPTSKTIKNSDFYKESDNAIFAEKDGDLYNTYYVDSESNQDISIPFNSISNNADITNVKLANEVIYDTKSSIKLDGGYDLDSDLSVEDSYHIKWNPSNKLGFDTMISTDDKESFITAIKIFMKSNKVSSIKYKDEIISIENLTSDSIDSISDFYNNAEIECTGSYTYLGLKEDSGFQSFIRDAESFNKQNKRLCAKIYIKDDSKRKSLSDRFMNTSFSDNLYCFSRTYQSEQEMVNNQEWSFFAKGYDTSYTDFTYPYSYDDFFYLTRFYSTVDNISDKYSSERTNYFDLNESAKGTPGISKVFFNIPCTLSKNGFGDYADSCYSLLHELETSDKGIKFYLNDEFVDTITDANKTEDSSTSCGFRYSTVANNFDSYYSSFDWKIYCPRENFNWFLSQVNKYYNKNYTYSSLVDAYYSDYGEKQYCFRNSVSVVSIDLDNIQSDCLDIFLPESLACYLNSGNTYNVERYGNDNSEAILDISSKNDDYSKLFDKLISEGYISRVYVHNAKNKDINYGLLKNIDLNMSKDEYSVLNNKTNFGTSYITRSIYYASVINSFGYNGDYLNSYGCDVIYFYDDSYDDECSIDMNTLESEISNSIKVLEDNNYVIDYNKSWKAISSSGYKNLSNFINLKEFNEPTILCSNDSSKSDTTFGSYTKKVDSIYIDSSKEINNLAECTNRGMKIANNFCKKKSTSFNKGIEYPITVQAKVNNSAINTVKNVPFVNGAILYDDESLKNSSNILSSYTLYEYNESTKDIIKGVVASYFDYKFGNIIFASRPSVVQDLAIDDEGNVTWNKSADEGLGVDDNGKSKSDDIVKLESYTLYVSDKDGNELYTTTATPSAVSVTSSAIQTPVVTKSAVSVKKLRGMSLSSSKSDALFTIPDEYNVAGNIITVYATNVLGDSDEVSITIPAKVTPTPTPTATPTVKPTATPTKRPSNPNPPVVVITNTPEVTATPTVEPTVEPTVIPTSTPVPEYKLTVEDVYYDEDGTKEKSEERLTITVKEGEHYSYPSLDKDNYIARVSKFEGTVTSDVKLVFEYDKKKSKDLIVQGYVKKSDGTPVDNSLVEIVDKESKSDITDNTGFYRIEGVSEGEHDYTLYSGTTTGSSIVAKCKISVKDNNGKVKITFKSEDSKIDTQTEEGVVRIDATLFDEEVTQSPAPTKAPTSEPTVEPTVIPSPVPTEVPTSEPTIEPTVIPTVVPTPVDTTRPAVTASPEPTVTPTPVVTTRPAVTASPEPTVTPPSDMPTPFEPDEVETPKPTKKPIKNTDKVVGNSIYTPEPDNEVKEERVTLVQTGLYDNTKSVVGLILTSLGVCILFISLKKRNKK